MPSKGLIPAVFLFGMTIVLFEPHQSRFQMLLIDPAWLRAVELSYVSHQGGGASVQFKPCSEQKQVTVDTPASSTENRLMSSIGEKHE